MALTKVIDGVTAIVDLDDNAIFITGTACVVDAVGLLADENVLIHKLMSDGSYQPAANKKGTIYLSAYPNIVILDAPGTYKLTKPTVTAAVTCGYEEMT